MKLILHIGTEKTGTTTLQGFLYKNKDLLRRYGVALSSVLGEGNNRKLAAFFRVEPDDYWKMKGLRNLQEKEAFFEGFLESFRKEVSEAEENCRTFVVTSEHFHSRLTDPADIGELKGFLGSVFHQIEVHCYLREQSSLAVSLYSTEIKTGNCNSYADFVRQVHIENPYYNYSDFLKKWGRIFGKDNLKVKIFDRDKLAGGDIRKDFLLEILSEEELGKLEFQGKDANESFGAMGADIGRVINTIVPRFNSKGINPAHESLMNVLVDSDIQRVGTIPNPYAQRIYESFEGENAKLSEYLWGIRQNPFSPPEEKLQETLELDPAVKDGFLELLRNMLQIMYSAQTLKDWDADILRDVAYKYETKESLSLDDAIYLLGLAKRAREGGPIINQRLQTLEKQRKAKDAGKGEVS